MNLASVLFQVGRRAPESSAVSGAGLALSYADLCGRAASIAGALRGTLGLDAGDRS